MEVILLKVLLAFGGGVLGSAVGAFEIIVFFAWVLLISTVSGNTVVTNEVAFGVYLAPYVAFAGGVGAAAYAGRKKLIPTGADITVPLFKLQNPVVLIVGGIFGSIGYLFFILLQYLQIKVDFGALIILVLAVVSRLMFGKTGLLGKYKGTEKRKYFVDKNLFFTTIVFHAPVALLASYFDLLTGNVFLGFAISVSILVFFLAGFEIPPTHHVTMIAGYAAVATQNILIGMIAGVIAGILCDIVEKTINSYQDSHIDPPATVIAFLSFIILTFIQK